MAVDDHVTLLYVIQPDVQNMYIFSMIYNIFISEIMNFVSATKLGVRMNTHNRK